MVLHVPETEPATNDLTMGLDAMKSAMAAFFVQISGLRYASFGWRNSSFESSFKSSFESKIPKSERTKITQKF